MRLLDKTITLALALVSIAQLPFQQPGFPNHNAAPATGIADNCGLIINAGPDKFVCDDNPTTILEGFAGGSGLLEYEWSPPDGLSRTDVLTPRVDVTGKQCYVLTGKKKGTVNLVTNGDFSAGATGFITDYVPGTMSCFGLGFLDCAGTYAVLNNPQSGHTNFAPCGDHTTGSGNMLVCNGAPGFVNVWCQTIPVTPDRDYCISAWAASVNPSSPAQLEFSINGAPFGYLGLSGTTCQWEQLTEMWYSGGNGIATICIVNQNTVGSGNDFAVDDISMYEICEQTDTVCVDIVKVDAIIQPPMRICCNNPTVQLDGTGSSSGPGYTYCWEARNGGHILSGENTLMPLVDRPGTYILMVKGPEGCMKEVEVEVEGNLLPPRPYAEAPDTIDCDNRTVEIFGGASPDDGVTYQWSGPNGFTSFEQSPEVGDTGIYTLVVTDECGCFSTIMVEVYGKDNLINGTIQGDSLDCQHSSIDLIATSSRPNSSFNWTGPNGYICDSDTCQVTDTGWYFLRTTNNEGCEDLDSFLVRGDLDKPDISIVGDTLTCDKSTIDLKAISSGGESYAWTYKGLLISGDSTVSVTVGGQYTVVVEGKNGCTDSLTYFVETDTSKPFFNLDSGVIECSETFITICFDTLSPFDADYQWLLSAGPVTGQNCVDIQEEGWVRLIATRDNGCIHVDSVFIEKKDSRPQVDADILDLNCHVPSFILKPEVPASRITWTLPSGSTLVQDSLIVAKAGWYYYIITSDSFECEFIDSFEVTEDFRKPRGSLEADTLTCLRSDVVVRLTSPDSLIGTVWSGPDQFTSTEHSPSVSASGTYQVIITGINGCLDTLSIDVLRDANYPDVSLFGDTIDCHTTTVEVGATASRSNLDYNWQGPNGLTSRDSSFIVSDSGAYRVTVTSPEGCIIIKDINISLDTTSPQFTLIGDNKLDCRTTVLQLSYSSTSEINTVNWTGPNGFTSIDDTISVTQPGQYNLTLTAGNGCENTRSVSITQDTTRPSLTILGDTITCSRSSVELQGISIPNVEYLWITPSGDSVYRRVFNTSEPGLYRIIVTGRNYCSRVGTYDLVADTMAPILELSGDIITCDNPRVWLFAGSGVSEAHWTGNGIDLTGDSILVSEAGRYFASALGKNDCIGYDSIDIAIDTIKPRVLLTGTDITCDRTFAELRATASSGTQTMWLSQNGTFLTAGLHHTTDLPGQYRFVAIDSVNGCETQSLITVNDLRDLPVPEFEIFQPDCDLAYGSIAVGNISGGQLPYLVSLNGGTFQTDRYFGDLDPGNYIVEVKDANGCISSDTVTIKATTPLSGTLSGDVEIELGDAIGLSLQIRPDHSVVRSIRWSPSDGLSCSDCFDPLASPTASTTYQVEVTDTNGCVIVLSVFVKVNIPGIYVPNVFTPANGDFLNDRFYPFSGNPEIITIDVMRVYSRWGEIIFENRDFHPNDRSAGWDGTFRGERVNPAVFVYTIEGTYASGEHFLLSGDVTIVD